MDVCLLCLYLVLSAVGRGLCDELIPRPKEPNQVSHKIQKPKITSRNVDTRANAKKNKLNLVRFQVLTAASMMFRIVFWDVFPCKIIVDRRFRGTYCFHPETSVDNYFTRQYIPEDNSEQKINLVHQPILVKNVLIS
jgi:hypothetical protein